MLAPTTKIDNFPGLQRGYYACILTDWGTKFSTWSVKGESERTPQKKYTTLSDAEITDLAVELGDLAARDAFMFHWDTGARIAAGFHIPIMRAAGFKPTAIAFTWLKLKPTEPDGAFVYPRSSLNFGPGLTTRKGTEVCILGRRGSPKRISASVREVIIAPRREHSRKPDEVYDRIREYCDGPRLEICARTVRAGWDYALSDQLNTFKVAA